MPIFQPSTRNTFVAPRLPEPCLRRSTPFALAREVRERDRSGEVRQREREGWMHVTLPASRRSCDAAGCAADCP